MVLVWGSGCGLFAQTNNIVDVWLSTRCNVGQEGDLETELLRAGAGALAGLVDAAQNGPNSSLLSLERLRATAAFDVLAHSYASAGQYGLSAADIQILESETMDQFVTDDLQNYILRYRSAGLAGLGVIGSDQAKRFLQSFAQGNNEPLLQAVAQHALLSLTGSSGNVHSRLVSQGFQTDGTMYMDLELSAEGPSAVKNVTLLGLEFHTISGTNAVTATGPATPFTIGYLPAGITKILRIGVNVPATVLRFSVKELFSIENREGNTHSYSQVQLVAP
jgi:hypothetical protein